MVSVGAPGSCQISCRDIPTGIASLWTVTEILKRHPRGFGAFEVDKLSFDRSRGDAFANMIQRTSHGSASDTDHVALV